MKKTIYFLLLSCVSVYFPLCSHIIETPHFSDILNYINPNTLVILDIDDTLLLPTQTLGTDAWFLHRLKYHQDNQAPAALDKALAEWEAIRHLTHVKIVEEGTEKVIEAMQKRGITVMGLTTQGLALATRTINQLRTLHIDLTKTAPAPEDHYFINQQGVLYRQGVLFTSGSPKGPALLKLLAILNYCPEHVIFINDKATHLKDVESSVIEKGIDFLGLRYNYSDERVANFNPEIAEIQWKHSTFMHILSDQEAEEILNYQAM
jgi:hypothetical protein